MKKIILLLGLFLVLSLNGYFAAPVFGYSNLSMGVSVIIFQTEFYDDKIVDEYNLSMGKNLEVDLITGGSIKITGWNKEKVKISCDGSVKNCDLKIEETSNGLKISQDIINKHGDHGDFVLEINAPNKLILQLHTNGGELSLDNIEGEFEGKTMGGDLLLWNLKGNLNLETMGGDISLKNSIVDGTVTTMGGEIKIEDVVGDIKGKSMGGDVSYRNITNKKGESTGKAIIISTMGGELNVDNAPDGADLNTMGGEIKVENAKKFVKAKTMGGDVKVSEIDGWIEASTMGGDVSVNLLNELKNEKHDVKLISMGGDITLYVPENFPMDVDITLAFTKDHEGDVDIISDFNLSKEITKEWDIHKGSKRKYIYGKAKLNGAQNKVVIETVNGNIYLKKTK